MKSNRFISLFITLLCLTAAPLFGLIEVSPSGTHYVGDNIGFRSNNAAIGNATGADWDFGDGATTSVTYAPDQVFHTYTAAGEYTVTMTANFYTAPPITETYTIMINPPRGTRYLGIVPASPVAGETVTITAYSFVTPNNVYWDLGDGTVISAKNGGGSRSNRGYRGGGVPMAQEFGAGRFGSMHNVRRDQLNRRLRNLRNRGAHFTRNALGNTSITHTYTQPGTYTVRAYDWNGSLDLAPITLRVTVALPARSITFSPTAPVAGLPVTFNAVNFLSSQIDWDFGDGNEQNSGGVSTTHVYQRGGTFTVSARGVNSELPAVTVRVTVSAPNRQIAFTPAAPRADQYVTFTATGFLTNSIDWNFGGDVVISGGAVMTHYFPTQGTFTISAKDSAIDHTPVTISLTVLEDNRYITVTTPEVRTNQPVTVQAFNFRGDFILWDFGDGARESAGQSVTHTYTRAGTYTITAYDRNGESARPFSATVRVRGLSDEVNLEIAELKFDNGKYYRVVNRNSKGLSALLRLKINGTGLITGYWTLNGQPFEYFNRVNTRGSIMEIRLQRVGGFPTTRNGIQHVGVVLTRPAAVEVNFPQLKYYVMGMEKKVEPLSPTDGFLAKEGDVPVFSWKKTRGAASYQIAFANFLYPIITGQYGLRWHPIDISQGMQFKPGDNLWGTIKRNHWTYWRLRALDAAGNVIAYSDVQDIKVVIATAKISIDGVTDLNGGHVTVVNGTVNGGGDDLLVNGSIQYMGDSKYIVLRVYVDDQMVDQLLFRNVKKEEIRRFETSIPHTKSSSRVSFQVLKTSSPAILVGMEALQLRK